MSDQPRIATSGFVTVAFLKPSVSKRGVRFWKGGWQHVELWLYACEDGLQNAEGEDFMLMVRESQYSTQKVPGK